MKVLDDLINKKQRPLIAPSIISADFLNIINEIQEVEDAGADFLHLDCMDGIFVPNITFGPMIVNMIRQLSNIPIDVHLMIQRPEQYIEDFVKAGADIILIHPESEVDIKRVLSLIRKFDKAVGLAINPDTSVESVRGFLAEVDIILVMSVNPGFSGQEFIENSTSKMNLLKGIREEYGFKYLIGIDGGINRETAPLAVKAGADILISASYIFDSRDRKEAIRSLKNL